MNVIFDAFEKEDVGYLHFKSNTDLDKSFAGKADFDVLIEKRALVKAERILLENGAKRHNPLRYGNYPGVDNYLVFDPGDGRIYHLHLHCQLATGKSLIKDYVIPWDKKLIESRVKDEIFGIYRAEPAMELLLLLVRSVVKSRPLNFLRSLKWHGALHPSMEAERSALIKLCDGERVRELSEEFFGSADADFITQTSLCDRVSLPRFARLSRLVRSYLREHRRLSGFAASCLCASHTFKKLMTKRLNRYLGYAIPVKKTVQSGGAIIAFVGIDGAGKSTVTGEISRWLGKNISCESHYMGVGDGKTTIKAAVMKKAAKAVSKPAAKTDKSKDRVYFTKSPVRYIKRLAKMYLILDVEKNNAKKLVRMNRFRLNGGVCILDRFPQSQMKDKNDGPKADMYAQMLGDNIFTRSFKKKEPALLAAADRIRPDLLFRLTVPAQTGLERKGDPINETTVKAHQDKLDSLMAIDYSAGGTRVVDIDTSMPYEEELLEIKSVIWEYV